MQIKKHSENCSWNYFGLFRLLHSLSNKVIRIKSFFYNNLLSQLCFPINVGIYINSQSNFVLIQNSTICEKQALENPFSTTSQWNIYVKLHL